MSYPKKTTKTQPVKSGKTEKEWEQQRDKNYGIQKRDQLKTLLTNKLKTKYSVQLKDPNLEALVAEEVAKFICQSTLTEANLQKLDTHIGVILKERMESAKMSVTAQEKKPESRGEELKSRGKEAEMSEPARSCSGEVPHKAAADEWACIVDYNKKQFDEEQQALLAKKKDMKEKLKLELDKQVVEKKKLLDAKKLKEREVEAKQVKLETDLELKERVKDIKQKEKVVQEKMEAQRLFESKTRLFIA